MTTTIRRSRIGRKIPLMIAILLQSLTGLLTIYAPWYEMFLIFKFISAVATGGTMLVSFVLRKFSIESFIVIYWNNLIKVTFTWEIFIISHGNCGTKMEIKLIGTLSRAILVRIFAKSFDSLSHAYMDRISDGCVDTTDSLTLLLLVSYKSIKFMCFLFYTKSIQNRILQKHFTTTYMAKVKKVEN